MTTIAFVPGAVAGALMWRQNCDSADGVVGCVPAAPTGGRDFVSWCAKSNLQVDVALEVDEIAGINSCVRVPAERAVTGAAATLTGCRVQDAAFLELASAATPIVWSDPAQSAIFTDTDEVGYKMADFGSVACNDCGGGCNNYSMVMWTCAFPLRGCQATLPNGVYAVAIFPSFQMTQPRDMRIGGGRETVDDTSLNFTVDMFELDGNPAFFPCSSGVAGDPQTGPIFSLGGPALVPDLLGLEGSPLAVFLTDIAPPTTCDCCGAAGFWSGVTDGNPAGTSPITLDAGAVFDALSSPEHMARMEKIAAELGATVGTPEQEAAKLEARVEHEKAIAGSAPKTKH